MPIFRKETIAYCPMPAYAPLHVKVVEDTGFNNTGNNMRVSNEYLYRYQKTYIIK